MIDDLHLYRTLADASSEGIWVIGVDGETLWANPRMAELLGCEAGELAHRSVYDFQYERGEVQLADHPRWAHDGSHADYEVRYLQPSGSTVWLRVALRPLYDEDGLPMGTLHRFVDSTEQHELLDASRYQKQLLGTAQQLAKIGSWEWDVVSGETRWSEQALLIYGIDHERVPGDFEAFLDFIHPDDRNEVRSAIAATFEGDAGFDWSARVIRGDGETRWCRCLGQMERGPDGAPIRITGTGQDITDQVRADEEIAEYTRRLTLLRQVAEAANQSTSLGETLVRTSGLLSEAMGCQLLAAEVKVDGDVVPLPLVTTAPPSDAGLSDVGDAFDLVARAWHSRRLEHAPVRGRVARIQVALPILHGGDVACVLTLVMDEAIANQEAYDLLAQIAGQLGRVAERERAAAELAEARDQAMEASRLKSEFLATMSHEIRTPMNGVIGLNDLLLRTGLTDSQRRLAEGLHGAGVTLRGIINDILDLSKIEAGKLELEFADFEVRPRVEQVTCLLQRQADDKGLDLIIEVGNDVPAFVRGDAVRWGQILTNLGSNAVKFTDAGRVTITVGLGSVPGERVVLETAVNDTGPGIDLKSQQRLFDAFTQGDPSTTRRHGGTGLGLTIARQLAGALGGELILESEVGEGTTFRFTSTFGAATDGREGRSWVDSPRPVDAVVHRILVVEDNEVNQMVAVGLLESAGYVADVVVDGVQAVEALTGTHGYAAVLMDCRTPRMDGFEATRTIREREAPHTRVPIIALTASALAGERERCLAAGMDDFLTKPVDSERLHAVVQRWTRGMTAPSGKMCTDAAAGPGGGGGPGRTTVVIDNSRIDLLNEMVVDGVSLFQSASSNFIANASEVLTALGAAVVASDADRLAATAHKLRGSALNLGLPQVGAAACELEEQGRTGRVDPSEETLALLTHEMTRALTALRQARAARNCRAVDETHTPGSESPASPLRRRPASETPASST